MGVCGGSNLRRDMYESWARTPVSSAAHAPCLQTRQFSQRVRVPCISRSHRLRPSRVTPAKFARKRTLSIPAALHEVGSCRLGTTANPPTTGILRNRPRFRFCDGFRMPAHHDAIHAHHGPAFESRRGRKARGVGHPAQRALWRFGWRRWRSVGLVKQAGSAANER